ncbi:4Fe-4S dicluster domain-containing protein [uncultured Adlercreutzia sp.]|uniref:4Fe-4S dicluster domain-containing protein n=1 Tax=uncultured Adlercreutzia sp. TaxID=875803 RepID=UPI0026F3FFA5|nr:4Fe-4S dicluster domain-containing protein [uncultured Adlercreutzia sp.]
MSPEAKRAEAPGRGISRRTFAIGAVGSAAMLGLGAVKLVGAEAVVRPPGAQDEGAFIASCIHCERCREVCPQHAIKPARLETGIVNLRTPQMDYRTGWCDFCENEEGGPACAAACPTKAFRLPASPVSENAKLGLAVINRDWCLAFSAMGCHECVDACPYEAMGVNDDGTPYVIDDACNGCGACEYACVSLSSGSISVGATDRAIVVVPLSEVHHG